MSVLREKWLHKVVIIRDGSTNDGCYGLVTQIIEGSQYPLTVTFWMAEGFRNDNYYAMADVELTDQAWNDNLPRDSQLRCIYDKHYTHLYYICGKGGRDINGYGSKGIAWAHWFKEHDDDATAALHTLIEEATNDESTGKVEVPARQNTAASSDGSRSKRSHLAILGERHEPAKR